MEKSDDMKGGSMYHGNKMKKWLREGMRLDSNTESQYRKRVKRRAKRELEYLTLVAKTKALSEEELAEIFNRKTMRPFFSALFAIDQDDTEEHRKRILGLWNEIFGGVLSDAYVMKLVSREVWQALTMRGDQKLQAAYYAAMFGK